MKTGHSALALAAALVGLAAAPQAQAQIACWYDGQGSRTGCDSCREGQGLSPPCDEGAGVCVVGGGGLCRPGGQGRCNRDSQYRMSGFKHVRAPLKDGRPRMKAWFALG